MMKKSSLLLVGLSLLALTGCEGSMKKEIELNGRYWQRVDATDSVFQRGPKAQQILFEDMSACVTTLNELDKLGALRNAIPQNTFDKDGKKIDPNSPEGRMADWDSPERKGYMLAEHMDYHDFDGCMRYKGWERVKFMNYETESRSRETYLEAIGYQQYRSTVKEQVKSDYSDLNQ